MKSLHLENKSKNDNSRINIPRSWRSISSPSTGRMIPSLSPSLINLVRKNLKMQADIGSVVKQQGQDRKN